MNIDFHRSLVDSVSPSARAIPVSREFGRPARQAGVAVPSRGGFDGLHRVERGDGPALAFIGIDQRHQRIQPVARRRAVLCTPKRFDLAQGSFVVGVGADGADVHGGGRMLGRRFRPPS